MKKYYSEPIVEVKHYSFNPSDSIFTTSGKDDLIKDDNYDILGNEE